MLDPDYLVDQLLRENDETFMALPDMEFEPHLVISRVRKQYLEYLIKLLSMNYENNQKLLNKNIYLPSAIWRCAKNIEMKAAQMCMVAQLYRKHIVTEISELKNDTKKGKLNKKLYEYLQRPPANEKKIQTTFDASEYCNSSYNSKQKRRKISPSVCLESEKISSEYKYETKNGYKAVSQIPVIINSTVEVKPQFEIVEEPTIHKENSIDPNSSVRISVDSLDSDELMMQLEKLFQSDTNDDDLFDGALCNIPNLMINDNSKQDLNANCENTDGNYLQNEETSIQTQVPQTKSLDERLATLAGVLVDKSDNTLHHSQETSHDRKYVSHKWHCEEYFLKLRLFEMIDKIGDCNRKKLLRIIVRKCALVFNFSQRSVFHFLFLLFIIWDHLTPISHDVMMGSKVKYAVPLNKTYSPSRLHGLPFAEKTHLDAATTPPKIHAFICKMAEIKDAWSDLFGEDSDDEGVVSPIEETPEFITSCKERIAPWVVKLLTPYYIKGRIRGKALFKTLAKHLIRLIYQCSKYPDEHEVTSFVTDFLKNHRLIRCEADFRQFRIDNI